MGQMNGAGRRWVMAAITFTGLMSMAARPATAQIGLYANFSGAKLNQGSTQYLFGPTIGVYKDSGHHIFATGFDIRASFLQRNGTHLYSGLGGFKVTLTPHILPLRPYAEAMLGIANYGTGNVTGSNASGNSTNVEYQFLGGIDDTILPHVDWRVIEFSYGGLSALNSTYNPKTISTGIVFRLR